VAPTLATVAAEVAVVLVQLVLMAHRLVVATAATVLHQK
jgi:hypothetical protein